MPSRIRIRSPCGERARSPAASEPCERAVRCNVKLGLCPGVMNKGAQFACQCVENRGVRNKGARQLSRDAIRLLSPEQIVPGSGRRTQRKFDGGIVGHISERRSVVLATRPSGRTQDRGEAK